MSKPIAVIISDVHYNINTLPLATAAVNMALEKAEELKVPLVVSGDMHDTKAHMRAECVLKMIETFSKTRVAIHIIPGNHCMVNEKSDQNALEFLIGNPRIYLWTRPIYVEEIESWLIPYQSGIETLEGTLSELSSSSRLIMHQGVQSAYMGHYLQDKTSLPKEAFADFRVISGHYHRRQDIKCGRPRKGAVGLFSYVGNPYTLSFGEATDPPKGFQILNSDGILTFVPTNLRKHIVAERTTEDLFSPVSNYIEGDLLWVKVTGVREELEKINKKELGQKLIGHSNFKLDKMPTDTVNLKAEALPKGLTEAQMLDALIDKLEGTDKQDLKKLWRDLVNKE